MLFNSLTFLFVFLPLTLLIYYLIRGKSRNYLLFLSSIIFYSWGGVSYSIILLSSVIMNYMLVKILEGSTKHKKIWLITGLIVNVFIIGVFKYLDFFIENINLLGQLITDSYTGIEKANIVLPLGISFFTFQQMSMLWDVYRNESRHKAKFINTALYISFFPQLIAGPIVRYNDIIDQIKNRVESIDLFNSGIYRFIIGLFKKVVIANTCAIIADAIMESPIQEVGFSLAWLGIISYAFQIFFDFSGYSDMAIGLGRMFGFRILENFNYPYISTSIKEFWRRWHISLSSWFRDYVYIPLGGNRKGETRTYVNLLIVFLLTGFWHGATWSFVFWGVFHGIFLIIERLGFDTILKKIPKPISWIYTILVVLIGWVYFRIENFSDATMYIKRMFEFGYSGGEATLFDYLNQEKIIVLLLAVILSTPCIKNVYLRLMPRINGSIKTIAYYAISVVLLGVFLYCILFINSGSYNPFIYFRF